ncbi:MAG TPA: YraN family protein [Alloprevotella sp.]|nr:YraN family protein [Alloprevotella sp.]
MAEHNLLGQKGEEEACRHLTRHDYRLLHRNWRCAHLEIDIVAEYFGELVFVEVKTRRNEVFAEAIDAVTPEKKKNIIRAARAYMACYRTDQPFRFDIITIIGEQPPFKITHTENAFGTRSIETLKRKICHEY